VIVLNKTDLVDEADVDLIEVKVRDIKEGARILRTKNSEVPLPLILSVGLFESDQYFEAADAKEKHDHEHHSHDDHAHEHHAHDEHHAHAESAHGEPAHGELDHVCTPSCDHDEHHDHDHHDHHDHDHDHHYHSNHLENDGFSSLSFKSDRPFSIRKFQHFLDNLLPDNVFRAKGILWFKESPQRHIFHLSGKRFTLEDSEWKGEKQTQLVLIGQDLDQQKLYDQIEKCLSIPEESRGKGFGK
jgi:G3E family GTPase